MGKSQAKKVNGTQQKELSAYKKQEAWIKWAGLAILILVLLLFLLMGYASDWWQGANKDSLRQFAPTSATGTEANGGPGTQDTTTTTGGSSGTTTRESTTTNNTTTNNNNTTTPPTTPPNTGPDPSLLEILAGINTGDTIDEAIAYAESKGADVDCRTELLILRVCDISVGDDTVTVKGLLSDDIITGISDNF